MPALKAGRLVDPAAFLPTADGVSRPRLCPFQFPHERSISQKHFFRFAR
jgi:hypothetical protein